MSLIDVQGGGRFLSEALPHLFPEPGLSRNELELWAMHYDEKIKNKGL